MEKVSTEEVMDNLDMFQSIFGKINKFGWWDLKRISVDAGLQFTSKEFKEEFQTLRVHLKLAALEHQEINGQVEVTWRPSREIPHSTMVHVRFLGAYIHFSLMYTANHIFTVLPIKDLINEDGEPTTPFKLATGKKHFSITYTRVICLCVVRKATAHVEKLC